MQVDFAVLLVIATLVTGFIWLLDALVLGPRRARSLHFGSSVARGGGKAADAVNIPWYVDFSRSFFPIILAVLVLRSFVVEPFRIPSGSMEPTLYNGDFILVNKWKFGLRLPVLNTKIADLGEPKRGDVAVFRYPKNPSVAYIKRIVGLPGDRLQYRNKQLYINGEPVAQERLATDSAGNMSSEQLLEQLGDVKHLIQLRKERDDYTLEKTVPSGHYFAMGDNRDNSSDSRVWGFLPEQNLIGKAFLIWMNWDCITGNGNCNRIGRTIK
ncbi:MAG: signal peptidase I [Gammaproteobacteria bacterium]